MELNKETHLIGGCSGTQYGCCPDGTTSKNQSGSNCGTPTPVPAHFIGGCGGTEYGCCPDGVTPSNPDRSNCFVRPRPHHPHMRPPPVIIDNRTAENISITKNPEIVIALLAIIALLLIQMINKNTKI